MTADARFAAMPALWSPEAVVAATGGAMPSLPAAPIRSVSIDTRTLEPGALFFAIRGETHDGHDFVDQALEKGAAAAVVNRDRAGRHGAGAPLLIVEDTLAAMEALGRAARARMRGPVLAVTGSVGKTSTKEMARLALSRLGAAHASVASYNNHWGVPLTLARMPAASEFAVVEIGMSNAFEILPLTAMARPHVAIVTTVAPVHLAQFRGIEGIADAKGEIFAGLEPGGVAIIEGDNPLTPRLAAHAGASRAGRIIRFGAGADNDVRLLDIRLDPDFSIVSASVFGTPVTYRIGAAGEHLARNSLAVLAAAQAIGADLALVALSLQDFGSVEGRGRRALLRIGDGRFTLIDESYNANPTSMRAALAVAGGLPRGARGRRIAVLGDMLELGPGAATLHAALGPAILANDIDLVFAAGPLMRALYSALPAERRGAYAENSEGLEPLLLDAVHHGDVVMVKGSLGSRMGRIVKALRARFPEIAAGPAEA